MARRIDAGDMAEVVTVERPNEITDPGGKRVTTYTPLRTRLWCAVEQRPGRQLNSENALQVFQTVTFRCRWTDLVRSGDRLLWQGRRYRVEAVAADRRADRTEITTQAA